MMFGDTAAVGTMLDLLLHHAHVLKMWSEELADQAGGSGHGLGPELDRVEIIRPDRLGRMIVMVSRVSLTGGTVLRSRMFSVPVWDPLAIAGVILVMGIAPTLPV
jgi:hypothetical protein